MALPVIGLLITSFPPEQDAYADYGFSLLAALSAAGCIGYVVDRISRRFGIPLHYCLTIAWLAPVAVPVDGPGQGKNWPLLVALLFGPILILLAGLGGWVEFSTRSRGSYPAAQNFPV